MKIFEFCDKWCPLRWVWSRRTTIMGYITVMWGVLELNPNQVGDWVAVPKRGAVILIVGMINAAIGHYNNALVKRLAANQARLIEVWCDEYKRLTGRDYILPNWINEE